MSITALEIRDKTMEREPVLEQVSEHGRFVTEEEYWENYYEHPDFNYEWNNGILEELGVSDYKNVSVYGWFYKLLSNYLETRKNGKIVALEFGFRLKMPRKTTIRKPDIAIVLLDNLTPLDDEDNSFLGVYDMCIEIISDERKRDIDRDTIHKKNEYQIVGVKEYYILDASYRYMAFYRRNKLGYFDEIQPSTGDIINSEILKGFQFRISDLIKRPTLEELANDALYNSFIMPSYKIIQQQAEVEKQRAEAEKRNAEREKQRAEAEKRNAERERQRAESEKRNAEREKQRAETEKRRAELAEETAKAERRRAEILAAKLRELGVSVE
jgi:Uma2 family endonuclease